MSQTLPIPYKEYQEPDMTFDCINEGIDPVVGTAGMIEFGTNASEHSSFQRASYETHGIWNKEDHAVSYTSEGKIAYEKTEENWTQWNKTGTQEWKLDF